MIPFSIEAFRQGKKVITRDGREIKQLTEFDTYLVGIIEGNGMPDTWSQNGELLNADDYNDGDLTHPQESRSDEDIAKEVYNKHGLDFTMQESHIKKLMLDLMTEAREDERQKYVQPNTNKLPVNSGKLPEDIAKEVVNKFAESYPNQFSHWDFWEQLGKDRATALVQAGIDSHKLVQDNVHPNTNSDEITVEVRHSTDKNRVKDFTFYRDGQFQYHSSIENGTYKLTPINIKQ